jgi:hypothetical protein
MATPYRLFFVIKEMRKTHGLWYVIKRAFMSYRLYYKLLRRNKTFTLQGRKYPYFYDIINETWANERVIEVSLALDLFQKYKHKKILEIGNVLSNYIKVEHDVIDKYEKDPHVINEDVADFKTEKRYNLIISISTLEHVGWDEQPRDPDKISKSIKNLQNHLDPDDGMLFVTMPFGYNQDLDKQLENGMIKFTRQFYMKRTSSDNDWVEVSSDAVRGAQYGYPYPAANAVLIGYLDGK